MKRKILSTSILIIIIMLFVVNGCTKENENKNSPPTIQSITSTPNTSNSNRLPAGGQAIVSVTAVDPDKDNLNYSWEANGGDFVGQANQSSVTWKSPINTSLMTYKITATVSDGALTTSKSMDIYVDKEVVNPTGNVEGYVYYSSTTIPVSGVLVSISNKSSTTGSNGYYEISDAPQGNQTLIATKDGYDTYSTNINIGSGTKQHNIEMTSALYTHNVFGYVTNQLENPITMVVVVVLNPDNTESNLKTTSSSTGYYQIPTVPQGSRRLKFIKETCLPYEIDIFMANSNYELDVELNERGLPCKQEQTVLYEGQVYNTVLLMSAFNS